MGIENNECVVATTWNQEAVKEIEKWVATLDESLACLFAFVNGTCNNKTTIFLAPCGSKKGWDEDEKLCLLRDMFIKQFDKFDYDDGSNPFDWVEIGYGEYGQKILRGNCRNLYSDLDYAV